jgi:RHS repeat-associated protein
MGCLALTYQEQVSSLRVIYKSDKPRALKEKPYFFEGVLEKTVYAEKKGANSYRYGFNGMEIDKEGLGGGGATYDYGFRIYNPQIAKFLSVDPLSSDYAWYTPYQFAGNKPIMCDDVDGLEEFIRTRYFDSAGNLYRTELQVIGNLGGLGGDGHSPGAVQLVHETRVQEQTDANGVGNGQLVATYMGSTIGSPVPPNSAGAPDANGVMLGQTGPAFASELATGVPISNNGSTALSLQENQALWNDVANGIDPTTGNQVFTETYISYGGTNPQPESQRMQLDTGTGNMRLETVQRGGVTRIKTSNPQSLSSGVVVINNGPAPANEAYAPYGANSTPLTTAGRYNIVDPSGSTPLPANLNQPNVQANLSTDFDFGNVALIQSTQAGAGTINVPTENAATTTPKGSRNANRTTSATF